MSGELPLLSLLFNVELESIDFIILKVFIGNQRPFSHRLTLIQTDFIGSKYRRVTAVFSFFLFSLLLQFVFIYCIFFKNKNKKFFFVLVLVCLLCCCFAPFLLCSSFHFLFLEDAFQTVLQVLHFSPPLTIDLRPR